MRYIGYNQQGQIILVSDKPISGTNLQDYQVLEISDEWDKFSAETLILDFHVKNGTLNSKTLSKPANKLKIALVGNWKMACGISTYADHLWRCVVPELGDFRLFIEEHERPTEPWTKMGEMELPLEKIVSCWKRGSNLSRLVSEIKSFDPDIVWIQHEFGLWPNARHWLSLMTQLNNYRVIVTMHSTFHHADKTIVEAAIPEIIVHLEGARKVLKEEKKVGGKVHLIPHGCYPYQPGKLWNFYKSRETFIQCGFLLPYKHFAASLQATAILKEKYPDVFFTGILSETEHGKAEHQRYYNELVSLVEKLGIQDNVALIRGFQSDESLDSYLRTNQAAVFPYASDPKHEVWGASGAARLAMSKGMPVVTSNINHFSDMPTLKADSPEALAAHLHQLFSNPSFRKETLSIQMAYVLENSWDKIAKKHLEIFVDSNKTS